jgi:AcrR family transcriptional regulator
MAGRNRTFDKEDALLKAMEVFWKKGYSGTSLSDLTGAMGINKPSLYAAFGNKEALFVSAINRYAEKHGVPHFDKLLTPDHELPDRLKAYLESIANMLTDKGLPGGCLVATSTCEASSTCLPEKAVASILQINSASSRAFVEFFANEQSKGNLNSDADPDLLADYLLTLQFGMAVMARNGANPTRLKKVIGQGLFNFQLWCPQE